MRLSSQQAQQLIDMAIQAIPYEICGLLVGSGQEVQAIIPIPNIAEDPIHFFEFDQSVFVGAMFEIQRTRMSLVGIYHSHPSGEPIPSQADVMQAFYPDVNYLIVGLGRPKPQLAAWNIRHYEVTNVDLQLDSTPVQTDQLTMLHTGRIAIVLSVVIAVCVALLIALSLLPPAPVIP